MSAVATTRSMLALTMRARILPFVAAFVGGVVAAFVGGVVAAFLGGVVAGTVARTVGGACGAAAPRVRRAAALPGSLVVDLASRLARLARDLGERVAVGLLARRLVAQAGSLAAPLATRGALGPVVRLIVVTEVVERPDAGHRKGHDPHKIHDGKPRPYPGAVVSCRAPCEMSVPWARLILISPSRRRPEPAAA